MTDWRDSVRASVADLPRTTDRATAVQVDFLPGAHGIVIEAAKARRVAVASYIRRAALAMACHDLGIPFSDALERDARISNLMGAAIDDPDGVRFGAWEIERLLGEEKP